MVSSFILPITSPQFYSRSPEIKNCKKKQSIYIGQLRYIPYLGPFISEIFNQYRTFRCSICFPQRIPERRIAVCSEVHSITYTNKFSPKPIAGTWLNILKQLRTTFHSIGYPGFKTILRRSSGKIQLTINSSNSIRERTYKTRHYILH